MINPGTICKTSIYGWTILVLSVAEGIAECYILNALAATARTGTIGDWCVTDLIMIEDEYMNAIKSKIG